MTNYQKIYILFSLDLRIGLTYLIRVGTLTLEGYFFLRSRLIKCFYCLWSRSRDGKRGLWRLCKRWQLSINHLALAKRKLFF